MRLPFLRKAIVEDKSFRQPAPLKTPVYTYTPSKTLTLIIHLPANGFVHLQPPLDSNLPTDIPGQYDHILVGELEVIAPSRWQDKVESIIVGVKALSELHLGAGREGEVDTLFERSVTLDELTISPGSQKFIFNLILPCTLTGLTSHGLNKTTVRAYANLKSTSDSPPDHVAPRDVFSRDNTPAPTSIEVEGNKVVYGTDNRMRIGHMTERDANFVTLDSSTQGMDEGLGIFDMRFISDIWSIAAPFHFTIKLPSLSPLITIFSVRLSLVQIGTIRSPRDPPDTPPISITTRIVLAKLGESVPAGHIHPGKERIALWRGIDAGGKGGGDGYEGEVLGRLPTDFLLRPSTVPGTITPIKTNHILSIEVFYSVYGKFADGQAMKPMGPGELRVFKKSEGIILPACVNVPGILHLPTYEESSRDQGEGHCACQLPENSIMSRIRKYVEGLRRADEERDETARAKAKQTTG